VLLSERSASDVASGMAEEEAAAAPAAAAPEAEAAKDAKENGAAGDAEPKDEEVKKCDKPNKEEFDAKVQKLNDEIAELNNKLSAIDVNIAKTKQTSGGGTDDFSQAKAQMKTLRDQKDKVMRERQEIADKRNAAKASIDKKKEAARSQRAELKYSNVDEIEKKIAELENRQQMTSMTLAAEKQLLKEIDALKQSKKAVAALSSNHDSISSELESQKSINEQLTEKSKELDEIKKQIDAQKTVLDGLSAENSEKRSALPTLFKEKDGIRAEKNAKVEQIKAMRNDFRKAENDFRNYLREVRKKRAEERKAEDEARDAERAERKKQWEAEEAKKVPYEEEMALCDYLVNYLETTFLNAPEDGAGAAEKKEAETVTEFEGFALSGKAARRKFDETDDFCNLGLGKKKGRGKKKGGAKDAAGGGKLVLAVDTFEHFSMIGVDAPITREAVAATVDAVKKKKEYYSTLPRGEVPSIREKQLAEAEKRAKAEREERRLERDGPPPPTRDARPAKPAAKEGKPAKAKQADFNALEAADNAAAFPGLPGKPAEKPAKAES